jgi:hypothetical protein
MGVYIFKSKHINAIKIGHYSKNNAWSRVAHRGFYSCICPGEIKNTVGVDDLELLYWFPELTTKDEKILHNYLEPYRICGEWFKYDAINDILKIVVIENKACECSKEMAIKSKKRI